MVSSVSVTLAMALTTTTGFCGKRPLTMAATRSMARASSTEVPPNFITIIGVTSFAGRWQTWMRRVRGREARTGRAELVEKKSAGQAELLWRCSSSQIAFGLQQFGVEHGRPGSSADSVVRQHGKFPVEH